MFNSLKKSLKRAFTITELVIVIAVIAILAAILIPTFANVISSANKSAALSTCRNALTDLEGQMAQDGKTSQDLYGTVFESDGYFYVFFNGELQYLGQMDDFAGSYSSTSVFDDLGDDVTLLGLYGGTEKVSSDTVSWVCTNSLTATNGTNGTYSCSVTYINEGNTWTASGSYTDSGNVQLLYYRVKLNNTVYLGACLIEQGTASYQTEGATYSFAGVVTLETTVTTAKEEADTAAAAAETARQTAAVSAAETAAAAANLTDNTYTYYVQVDSSYYYSVSVTISSGSVSGTSTVATSTESAYTAATYKTTATSSN